MIDGECAGVGGVAPCGDHLALRTGGGRGVLMKHERETC